MWVSVVLVNRRHINFHDFDFQTLDILLCALTKQTRTVRKAVIVTGMEPEHANVERDKFWFLKSRTQSTLFT